MRALALYRGQDMWLTLDRCIRYITGRGKILIAQFNANTPEERLRRTAMYMLVKNENSFININPQLISWYPEYKIELGEQSKCPKYLDELRIECEGWQSLLERKYSDGRVICNTSSQIFRLRPLDWIPESLGKEYIVKTSGEGVVDNDGIPLQDTIEFIEFKSEFILPASECLIIKIEKLSSIGDIHTDANDIIIYPNPAVEYINIDFENNFNQKINLKLFDFLGNCVNELNQFSKNKKIMLDLTGLKLVTYLLRMCSNGDVYYKKIIVL